MPVKRAVRDNGWRQGFIFRVQDHPRITKTTGKPIPDGARCVVVSHSCDLSHPNPDNEPMAEVLVGTLVPGKPDGRMTSAKNPRTLHVALVLSEGSRYFEFRIANRLHINRNLLDDLSPDESCRLEGPALRTTQRWLANRYTREALPNAFNKRITPVARGRIEAALKEHGNDINSMYIGVDPMTEIPEDKKYQVLLQALMADAAFSDAERHKSGWQAVDAVAAALKECGIEVVDASVRSMSDFSMAELELVMEWNFDWISLEQAGEK